MDTANQPVMPGNEPEKIKKYLQLFLNDLDKIYPMKLINQELWNHDRWDEPLFALCDALGYETGDELLHAYGFFYPYEETVEETEGPTEQGGEELSESQAQTAGDESVDVETEEGDEESVDSPEVSELRIRHLDPRINHMSPTDLFEESFAADADYPYEALQKEAEEKQRRLVEESKGVRRYIHNAETRRQVNRTLAWVCGGLAVLMIGAVGFRMWSDRQEAKAAALAEEERRVELTTEVENGTFSTSLTLPPVYVDPEITQKQYNQLADELGYKQIRIRGDGSVTYTVTRAQQFEMQEAARQEVLKFLKDAIPSSRYPDAVSITHNEDFTEFTLTVSNDKVSPSTEALAEQLAYYCGKYNYISGTGSFTCKVTVVNPGAEFKKVLKPKIPV